MNRIAAPRLSQGFFSAMATYAALQRLSQSIVKPKFTKTTKTEHEWKLWVINSELNLSRPLMQEGEMGVTSRLPGLVQLSFRRAQ